MLFGISVNDQRVKLQIDGLSEALTDWQPLLTDIGVLMLRSVDLNYKEQGRPDTWEPTWRSILENGRILEDTGALRASTQITGNEVKATSEGAIYERLPFSITVGTDIDYYQYLHETWTAIMFQEEDHDNINTLIKMHIEGALDV